jgi:hypothetical protein
MYSIKTIIFILLITEVYAQQLNETNLTSFQVRANSAFTNDSKAFYGLNGIFESNMTPITIGIGSGLEIWNNGLIIPLIGEFRYSLSENGIRPFLVGDVGYGFGKINDVDGFDKGGVLFSVGAGMKTTLNAKSDVLFEVGYFFQKAKVYHLNYVWNYFSLQKSEYLTDETYSGIVLSIAVTL